jgi:hypothetical protein
MRKSSRKPSAKTWMQTSSLHNWELLVVSVALLLFAVAQAAKTLKKEAGTQAQQIQANQYQDATGSQKQVLSKTLNFHGQCPFLLGNCAILAPNGCGMAESRYGVNTPYRLPAFPAYYLYGYER